MSDKAGLIELGRVLAELVVEVLVLQQSADKMSDEQMDAFIADKDARIAKARDKLDALIAQKRSQQSDG